MSRIMSRIRSSVFGLHFEKTFVIGKDNVRVSENFEQQPVALIHLQMIRCHLRKIPMEQQDNSNHRYRHIDIGVETESDKPTILPSPREYLDAWQSLSLSITDNLRGRYLYNNKISSMLPITLYGLDSTFTTRHNLNEITLYGDVAIAPSIISCSNYIRVDVETKHLIGFNIEFNVTLYGACSRD